MTHIFPIKGNPNEFFMIVLTNGKALVNILETIEKAKRKKFYLLKHEKSLKTMVNSSNIDYYKLIKRLKIMKKYK